MSAALPPELAGPPVRTVEEAAVRLHACATALPAGDGVGCFASMYATVTEAVGNAIAGGFFASSDFLDALDVAFANLFFDAVTAAATGGRVPRCWAALFERRAAQDVSALRFALAGMNAHINHDLSLAVVATLEARGVEPQAVHADYLRVNQLLDGLEPAIRAQFVAGSVGRGPDDDLADLGIVGARDAAWDDALVLWESRHSPGRTKLLAAGLDDAVAAGSTALLLGDPAHRVVAWAVKRL